MVVRLRRWNPVGFFLKRNLEICATVVLLDILPCMTIRVSFLSSFRLCFPLSFYFIILCCLPPSEHSLLQQWCPVRYALEEICLLYPQTIFCRLARACAICIPISATWLCKRTNLNAPKGIGRIDNGSLGIASGQCPDIVYFTGGDQALELPL
jgi:hypothetical protein